MPTIKTLPGGRAPILRSDRERWTYDDLRAMPETHDRYEIIDGVLYTSPSGHVMRHQGAVGNLYLMLANWVQEHDLGRVFVSPADVVASPERVVQPDVFFVAKERLGIVGAYVEGAPDFAVEVISPSSEKYDRVHKFDLYERIGVKEYWTADPDACEVEVYALREGAFEPFGTHGMGDEVRSALLEGFVAPVRSMFE